MPHSASPLTPPVRAFLEGTHVASLATSDPDGAPRQTVVWYRLEPDNLLLVNSRKPRRWQANLRRDPRLALSIVDGSDPYRWVGLTAEVAEVIEDPERAREDIVLLAHRYHPEGPSPTSIAAFRTQDRISFLVQITGVHAHLDE